MAGSKLAWIREREWMERDSSDNISAQKRETRQMAPHRPRAPPNTVAAEVEDALEERSDTLINHAVTPSPTVKNDRARDDR